MISIQFNYQKHNHHLHFYIPYQPNHFQVNLFFKIPSLFLFIFEDKLTYVGDYDFNGLSSADELSFRKNDQLEILDRY